MDTGFGLDGANKFTLSGGYNSPNYTTAEQQSQTFCHLSLGWVVSDWETRSQPRPDAVPGPPWTCLFLISAQVSRSEAVYQWPQPPDEIEGEQGNEGQHDLDSNRI